MDFPVSDGQSGQDIPVPISNTAVKLTYVSDCTVLQYGNSEKPSPFSQNGKFFIYL